jgi:uncharacterized protein (DUF433 family)
MILEPTTTVPLREDAHGVIRVSGTRVTLLTFMHAWLNGSSAEEIVEQFPALRLDDVHAVLAFVLRHRDQIDAFMREETAKETATLETVRASFPDDGFRERLLTRARARGLR